MCLWKSNPFSMSSPPHPLSPPSQLLGAEWQNQCFEPKVGIQASCRQTSLKCFLVFLCPVWQLYSLIISGSENPQVSAAGPPSCGAGVCVDVSSCLRSALGNCWSWTLIPTSRPSCMWMSWAQGECKLAHAGSSPPLFALSVEIKWEKLMW